MDYRELFISPQKIKSFMDSYMNRMLKDQDFTAAQVPFIMVIGKNEGLSMREISTKLGIDKGLTTRVIKDLIKKDLVMNNCEAARTSKLYLTTKGKKAYKHSIKVLEKAAGQIFEVLEPEEYECMRKMVSKINDRLDELYEY